MFSRDLCVAKLPRAGLGNMMLVWARALVFSQMNAIPLSTVGWSKPKFGPLLRGEGRARLYLRYFEADPWSRRMELLASLLTHERVREPAMQKLATDSAERARLFIFASIPHWKDYFADLRGHRELIRRELESMLAKNQRRELARFPPPVIAVHVRLGDFRKLGAGEDFKTVGQVRTPLAHFEEVIRSIRRIAGRSLPVTVFSDGKDRELQPLLAMENVKRAHESSDIVQMLAMAKAKIIVCSAGSTFSYWSAFLADAPILLHPDHVHAPIRGPEVNAEFFEGGIAPGGPWPALLLENIQAIAIP